MVVWGLPEASSAPRAATKPNMASLPLIISGAPENPMTSVKVGKPAPACRRVGRWQQGVMRMLGAEKVHLDVVHLRVICQASELWWVACHAKGGVTVVSEPAGSRCGRQVWMCHGKVEPVLTATPPARGCCFMAPDSMGAGAVDRDRKRGRGG